MRATVMYGAGDVRVETVPDPRLHEPTDALVRVLTTRLSFSAGCPRAMSAITVAKEVFSS